MHPVPEPPANRERTDFSASYHEFAWITNRIFREKPHKFQLGGNPPFT